jgi:hypothetical protein
VKLTRPVAAAIGVAVVAISGLAIAAPASAATNATFITASQIGTLGPSSSAPGSWNENAAATLVSGPTGLVSTSSAELVYTLPTPIPITGSALRDAADDTSLYTSNNSSLISMIFFKNSLGSVYRFQANAAGDVFNDTAATWTSNVAVNGRTTGTLSEFATDFAGDLSFAGSSIIAFDAFVNSVAGATFYTFTVNDVTFSFMPVPVVTGAAAQTTQAAFGTTGYPVTASGFLPGESVEVYGSSPSAGGLIATVPADGSGVASYTWIASSTTGAGTAANYSVTFVGTDTGVVQFFNFVVAAALAATGIEAAMPLAISGVLLLGGVALTVAAARRRRMA